MSALPDGTRLLHIGPHKTGTTAIQAALHRGRDRLETLGVHFAAGETAHPITAVMAAVGQTLPVESKDGGAARWRALVEEVEESTARMVVLSSEFFSEAPPANIRSIVDALGADRVHVVITLRPVSRILASQWQQYMQNRPMVTYDDALDYPGWLRRILEDPTRRDVTPSFWKRHRHDELVRTWVAAVGPERVTVVVVDENDRRMLIRSFEELLGIEEGTLDPGDLGANRSLTLQEVQMLRALNVRWLQEGLSAADYTRYVRFGAVRVLQERTPRATEEKLLTPDWAVERVSRIGADMAAVIAGSGARVMGDLAVLGEPSAARDVGENTRDVTVAPEVLARFAAGLIAALARTPAAPPGGARTPGELEARLRREQEVRAVEGDLDRLRRRVAHLNRELAHLRTVEECSRADLLGEVARRVARRVVGPLRRGRRPRVI
jgi:hypothetical protein